MGELIHIRSIRSILNRLEKKGEGNRRVAVPRSEGRDQTEESEGSEGSDQYREGILSAVWMGKKEGTGK